METNRITLCICLDGDIIEWRQYIGTKRVYKEVTKRGQKPVKVIHTNNIKWNPKPIYYIDRTLQVEATKLN